MALQKNTWSSLILIYELMFLLAWNFTLRKYTELATQKNMDMKEFEKIGKLYMERTNCFCLKSQTYLNFFLMTQSYCS